MGTPSGQLELKTPIPTPITSNILVPVDLVTPVVSVGIGKGTLTTLV